MTPLTPEKIETAREFLRCTYWQWIPGARALFPDEPWRALRRIGGGRWVMDSGGGAWDGDESALIPDIDDIATRGTILGLVQNAWEGLYTVSEPAMLTSEHLLAALGAAEVKGYV